MSSRLIVVWWFLQGVGRVSLGQDSPPLVLIKSSAAGNSTRPRTVATRGTQPPGVESTSHGLLILLVVVVLITAAIALALGIRRVLRRLNGAARLPSYRYFRVNQQDDGGLIEVRDDYRAGMDDSSEDELGLVIKSTLPVRSQTRTNERNNALNAENRALLVETSDEELIK